jgi:hypothetical protein
MAFDGTGDYLANYSSVSQLNANFGTGDFTIEGWVYFNSLAGTQAIADSATSPSSGSAGQWFFVKDASNKLGFGQHSVGTIVTSTGSLSATTWTHVAISRSGTTVRLYINGVQDGSATSSVNFNNAGSIQVGVVATPSYLNGYLQDLRITKGYARYTTNFTAPTAAFPTL